MLFISWFAIFFVFFFFFNDTATTEIYTLSLHDALPICPGCRICSAAWSSAAWCAGRDRKSTRLNSSHPSISYAVFCLKKKTNNNKLLLKHVNKNITTQQINNIVHA